MRRGDGERVKLYSLDRSFLPLRPRVHGRMHLDGCACPRAPTGTVCKHIRAVITLAHDINPLIPSTLHLLSNPFSFFNRLYCRAKTQSSASQLKEKWTKETQLCRHPWSGKYLTLSLLLFALSLDHLSLWMPKQTCSYVAFPSTESQSAGSMKRLCPRATLFFFDSTLILGVHCDVKQISVIDLFIYYL